MQKTKKVKRQNKGESGKKKRIFTIKNKYAYGGDKYHVDDAKSVISKSESVADRAKRFGSQFKNQISDRAFKLGNNTASTTTTKPITEIQSDESLQQLTKDSRRSNWEPVKRIINASRSPEFGSGYNPESPTDTGSYVNLQNVGKPPQQYTQNMSDSHSPELVVDKNSLSSPIRGNPGSNFGMDQIYDNQSYEPVVQNPKNPVQPLPPPSYNGSESAITDLSTGPLYVSCLLYVSNWLKNKDYKNKIATINQPTFFEYTNFTNDMIDKKQMTKEEIDACLQYSGITTHIGSPIDSTMSTMGTESTAYSPIVSDNTASLEKTYIVKYKTVNGGTPQEKEVFVKNPDGQTYTRYLFDTNENPKKCTAQIIYSELGNNLNGSIQTTECDIQLKPLGRIR